MNRINPQAGGFPAYIPTDYLFLQSAFKEAIEGLTKLYGNSFIISGVELDLVNSLQTAGWLCWKGEIMRVDAVTGSDFSELLSIADKVWVADEYVDPTIGPVTYADTTSKASHLIRRAKVVSEAIVEGTDFVQYSQMNRVKQETNLALGFASFAANIGPIGSFVGYVMDLNVIRFHGIITVTTGVSLIPPVPLFQLPDHFRTQNDMIYIVGGVFAAGELYGRLRINGASSVNPGRVELLTPFQTGDKIILDGVQFRLPL